MGLTGLGDWWQRRRVLREMRNKQRRDERDYLIEFNVMMEDAETAMRLNEPERAWQVWNRARSLFPDSTLASDIGLGVLADLHRFDEAEALMLEGCRRFPRLPFYLEGYAKIALRRHDSKEALARATRLQKKFPAMPLGYSIAANALRELERYDDAKSCLRRGLSHAPSDIHLWLDAGQLAIDTKDWQEGLDIYTKAKTMFRHVAAPVGIAICLKAMKRYDEAETELTAAQYGYPLDHGPWTQFALIAEEKGEWGEADRRWGVVRRRYPMSSVGYLEGRRALRQLGRDAEIEPMLEEAVERIRDDFGLVSEYAWMAHRREDWPAAAARWALMRERFPETDEGWKRGIEALAADGQEAAAAELRAARPA